MFGVISNLRLISQALNTPSLFTKTGPKNEREEENLLNGCDGWREVYHQRFRVNRLLVFIGAGVLIGALKLRNTYT